MAARILPFFSRPGPGAARGRERAFLPAALEIVETPASPTLRITTALISAFLIALVVWSYFGQVDIVATAPGKVIARDRTKVVQPSDTGEVREILVSEGDHVTKGQVLIRLDSTMAMADQARYKELLMRAELDRIRLRAELQPGLSDTFAGLQMPVVLIAAAHARLQAEEREQAGKLAKIEQETAQKRAELAMVDAEIAKIDAALPLVEARAEIRKQGLKTEFGSKLDYYQQQQQLVEMQYDRFVDQRKHEAGEAELSALAIERSETEAEFLSTAHADLAKADREIAEAAGELAKAKHRAELATLTSPIAGIVQDLSVHTLGGVVTPAQQLLRIVPTDGGIEVEALIANQDVGFVDVGQDVEIKIDTFPFTRYGLVHGQVREIARDAVEEPETILQRQEGSQSKSDAPEGIQRSSQLVYTARVALDQNYLNVDGKPVELAPGMAVVAEIKTGKRRVLDYLLSPFHRYSHDALRER